MSYNRVSQIIPLANQIFNFSYLFYKLSSFIDVHSRNSRPLSHAQAQYIYIYIYI